jgi:NAD(P)-dependent dehydrogenase (short-subunit alcohol dehydrogenase family)
MEHTVGASRVAFITGGAYGIGRGIVLEFVRHGDSVIIADRDEHRGMDLEKKLKDDHARTRFLQMDVRVESDVKSAIDQTVAEFGRIDVLCNNAGIEYYRAADEYSVEEWNAISETNLRGAFFCTKHAYPHLKESRGCVVHISSVQAFANESCISAYAASKAGLLGLTRGMALDFAKDGVRVNAVCPGAVQTGMMEAFLKDQPNPEQMIQKIGSSIPLGRVGQPEDIARAVYFLASPEAAYITGAALVVDGGLLARLST